MSIRIVDPSTWSVFDKMFGTNTVEEANELGIIYDGWKRPTKAERESFQGQRPIIGTEEFQTVAFSNELLKVRDSFAFDKSMLDMEAEDEDEVFEKALEVVSIMMSAAKVLPLDRLEKAKDIVRTCAEVLKRYLPDFQSITKLMTLAPAIKPYETPLKEFSKALDEAIGILAVGDSNSITKAADKIQDGIREAKKLKISKINDAVSGIKKDDIKSGPKKAKTEEPKDEAKSEEKKEEPKTEEPKSEEAKTEPQKKAAFTSVTDDPNNPFAWFMNQKVDVNPIDPLGGKSFPEAFRGDLNGGVYSDKQAPDFITQNRMDVPKHDPVASAFQPITQQEAEYLGSVLGKYPWINKIMTIANGNGYLIHPEVILDNNQQLALLFIRTFNNGNLAYLPDKSFIIDFGKVIDNRYGVWPIANPDGTYSVLEDAQVVYSLFKDKGKIRELDEEFMDKLFKYGLNGLDEPTRKASILYNERMLITNRRINLRSMSFKDMGAAEKNIIRGACIRMATKLDPAYGRFNFVNILDDKQTFVLTNDGVDDNYLVPNIMKRRRVDIYCTPTIEDGHTVLINSNTGTDIKYDLDIVFDGAAAPEWYTKKLNAKKEKSEQKKSEKKKEEKTEQNKSEKKPDNKKEDKKENVA